MDTFLRLIKNKLFWLQIAIAVLLLIIIMLVTNIILKKYTSHNKEVVVPSVEHIMAGDIKNYNFAKNFSFVIFDSTYNALYEPGLVISQNPRPGLKVKEGRKIYLTVASTSPGEVNMPDLINLTIRQAVNTLDALELKLGKVTFIPSFDKNAVHKQYFQGLQIEKNTPVKKGSVIDIAIGTGFDSKQLEVPHLIGKTPLEAKNILRSLSLNVGEEFFRDSHDFNEIFVYKTYPAPDNEYVNVGGYIDLYYSSDKSFVDSDEELEFDDF